MKRSPLKRKSALKRGKPLRKVSAKRRKAQRAYTAKRRAFLLIRTLCQARVRQICTGRSSQVHHRFGRSGSNYLNEATWLATCAACHEWVHQNANTARSLGLLA